MMENRHPELKLLHSVPNGGSRHIREAHNLKLSGVKAGIPDIHLPVARHGYCGLWIEMKAEKNKPSDIQKNIIASLTEHGNSCHVCYAWTEAVDIIGWYLGMGNVR